MCMTAKHKMRKGVYAVRLTAKYQATIPKTIRDHLHLKSGDTILYDLQPDNTVIVRKSSPLDVEYLRALNETLGEWNSSEDDQAYKDL